MNDMPEQLGELHGAFVLSTVGNAGIASIDPSAALVTLTFNILQFEYKK